MRFPLAFAIAWLLSPPPASAQPPGDATPGSLAPLVVIVTPMNGAVVGGRLRVQARVQHPSGLSEVTAVRLAIAGATSSDQPMAPNASYVLSPNAGIFEIVVTLAPGGSTLVATATDAGGRSTTSAAVAVSANDGRGDGNLLVRDDASPLCTACHALSDHGSESSGRTYGAWTTTCRDCHWPHRTRNLELVAETLTPPWITGAAPPPRSVRFSNRAGYAPAGGLAAPGLATFANGDGTGPCQVCHTRTVRWRQGAAADAIHLGNCAFCHGHRKGFQGRCEDCHAAPPATGAHAAHHGASAPAPPFPSDPRPLGCGSCHPTDPTLHGDGVQQVLLNPALVLPGGTRTTGAQQSGAGTGTTCLVACHYPLGAPTPSVPVAWTATGPLPCTSCHTRINPGGAEPTPRAGPSLHDPIFSEARPPSGEPTTCGSCHALAEHDAKHLTGDPALAATATVDATCIACHTPPPGPAGPPGQLLHHGADAASSRTPPTLPGWSPVTIDATTGDFHGGRRGTCFGPNGPQPCAPAVTPTGFGGTLRPPFYRGYPAMPCATCHAGHASGNAFLFAPVVNGVAVPAGTIDRTGIGAERLCEACHEGGRHERCVECHTDTIICPDGQCYMDPNATHVDPAPAGSACFWCHGHEGILRWTEPYSGQAMDLPFRPACDHCHGFGMPPPTFSVSLSPGTTVRVTGVTATGATVSWQTGAAASGWIEYGVGLPGFVTGSGAETSAHTVALTGLAPDTAYVWRVRSVDAFRNVLRTPIATFTTTAADAVPFPDVVPVGYAGATVPATTTTVNLTWYPVASPTGNPVQYRVELAEDPGFTTLVNGAPPDSGWIDGTATTVGGAPALFFPATLTNLPQDWCVDPIPSNTYYWRVRAKDTVTGVESAASPVDVFQAGAGDPWC